MTKMKNVLISRCLIGAKCRYDGKQCKEETICKIEKILKKYKNDIFFVAVCPEVDGGLSIPRAPAEISSGKVINTEGDDVTKAYIRGGEMALMRAKEINAEFALMKAKSPSCGCKEVYDGTYSGTLIPGAGIAAGMLIDAGFKVYSELDLEEIERELENIKGANVGSKY